MRTNSRRQFITGLWALCLLWSSLVAAAGLSRNELLALYLYRFALDTQWSNAARIQQYHLYIIGNDPELVTLLRKIATARKIHDKPFVVSQGDRYSIPDKTQLVYLDSNDLSKFKSVLDEIAGKNILLVTNNVADQRDIMINLLTTTDKIHFEINKANIINQNLGVDPDIVLMGGTEIDVAKLYHQVQQSLNQKRAQLNSLKKERVSLQATVASTRDQAKHLADQLNSEQGRLDAQKARLTQQQSLIDKQKDSIGKQQATIDQQRAVMESQQAQSEQLRKEVGERQQALDKQVALIGQRAQILSDQESKIKDQQAILTRQKHTINSQQSLLYSLGAIATLVIVLAFVIYFALRAGRKTNALLMEQKALLEQTSEDLANAKAIAEDASREKSTFLANMSHEIRTPMNAILGLTNLVLKTEMTPKQRDYLVQAQSAADSLLGIINDILDFSKIEARKLTLESIDFSLNEIVDSILIVSRLRADEKQVSLDIMRDPKIPDRLIGDPLRISQVLANLTSNAIKFTGEGSVTVAIEHIAEADGVATISFSVKDTGIGMTREQMDGLFQSFVQADSSTTRTYGGTGLGLAISQQLVELMGGSIDVQSQPGSGSEFRFTLSLPVSSDDVRLAERLIGLKVLVCCPDNTQGRLLCQLFRSYGYEADLAESAPTALALLTMPDMHVDLVCVADMDIEAFAPQVKSQCQPAPRIIMLADTYTGEPPDQDGAVDAHVAKPATLSNLFDAVSRAFGYASTLRERPHTDLAFVRERIGGARVLIVDDAETNLLIARELLEEAGIVSETATNGQEAISMVTAGDYDCVLMDIQMPVMDGYTATEQLRATGRDSLPIIAMTADAMLEHRQAAMAVGMNDHIAKPIDPDDLFEKLLKWVKPGDRIREAPRKAAPSPAPRLPDGAPGIDVRSGLRRVAGNVNLYLKLLEDFVRGYADAPARLEELSSNGDAEGATAYAHKVAGITSNLGMVDLTDEARKLQGEFSMGRFPESSVFASKLEAVLGSVTLLAARARVQDQHGEA